MYGAKIASMHHHEAMWGAGAYAGGGVLGWNPPIEFFLCVCFVYVFSETPPPPPFDFFFFFFFFIKKKKKKKKIMPMADLKKVTLPPPNGTRCQIFKFRDQKKKMSASPPPPPPPTERLFGWLSRCDFFWTPPPPKKSVRLPPPPPPTERLFGRRDFQIFGSKFWARF